MTLRSECERHSSPAIPNSSRFPVGSGAAVKRSGPKLWEPPVDLPPRHRRGSSRSSSLLRAHPIIKQGLGKGAPLFRLGGKLVMRHLIESDQREGSRLDPAAGSGRPTPAAIGIVDRMHGRLGGELGQKTPPQCCVARPVVTYPPKPRPHDIREIPHRPATQRGHPAARLFFGGKRPGAVA